jgi:uncharacterized protein YndB with AHSA1/START domain
MSQGDHTVDGQLEQRDGRWQLRFTRVLPHRPEKVWRALTEPEHLAAWFPTDIEGERANGAALRFVFRNGEGAAVEGKMIRYDPPSLLEFQWGGDETLRFDLQPEGDGTVLTFVNTFDELGKAARDAAGWHSCLDLLGYHLNDEEAPWSPTERWQQVHESYVGRFGPEASTIGPPASRTSPT